MIQFIKTIVPTKDYQEVQKLGKMYIVHLDREDDPETESTTCYECMVEGTPDIEAITDDLNIYKARIAEVGLRIAKDEKCKEISNYDTSKNVDSFEIWKDGEKFTDYWIDRDLRTSLEGDVKACKEISDTYKFDIREFGITLELDCDKFLAALTLLRLYAYTAYNVTSQHLANVRNLTTEEEVQNYDYTQNYPTKLIFNLEDLV